MLPVGLEQGHNRSQSGNAFLRKVNHHGQHDTSTTLQLTVFLLHCMKENFQQKQK